MASKLKKSGVKPQFTQDDLGRLGREYSEISAQIKKLEEQKKKLATLIKENVEVFGVKDDKGSYYFDSGEYMLGKVAKKSFNIKQDEAVQVLEDMGLSDVVDTITSKVVNEDRLTEAVANGRISINEVDKFTDTKVSYSVSVVQKKTEAEMPEVEQTVLSAARRK